MSSPDPKPRRRRRFLRAVLLLALALALALGAARLLAPTVAARRMAAAISAELDGAEVRTTGARASLRDGVFRLRELRIPHPDGFTQRDFLVVRDISFDIDPASLRTPVLEVEDLRIGSIDVAFERLDDGRTSFAEFFPLAAEVMGGGGGNGAPVQLSAFRVRNASTGPVTLRFINPEPERYRGEASAGWRALRATNAAVGPAAAGNEPARLVVEGLRADAPGGRGGHPLFQAESLEAVVDLARSLAEQRPVVRSVALARPEIDIVVGTDDRSNLRRFSRILMRYQFGLEEDDGLFASLPRVEPAVGGMGGPAGTDPADGEAADRHLPLSGDELAIDDGAWRFTAPEDGEWRTDEFASIRVRGSNLSGSNPTALFRLDASAVPSGGDAVVDLRSRGMHPFLDRPARSWEFELTMRRAPFHPFIREDLPEDEAEERAPRVRRALINGEARGGLRGGQFEGELDVRFTDLDITSDERGLLDRLRLGTAYLDDAKRGRWARTLEELREPGTDRTVEVKRRFTLPAKDFNPAILPFIYGMQFQEARAERAVDTPPQGSPTP